MLNWRALQYNSRFPLTGSHPRTTCKSHPRTVCRSHDLHPRAVQHSALCKHGTLLTSPKTKTARNFDDGFGQIEVQAKVRDGFLIDDATLAVPLAMAGAVPMGHDRQRSPFAAASRVSTIRSPSSGGSLSGWCSAHNWQRSPSFVHKGSTSLALVVLLPSKSQRPRTTNSCTRVTRHGLSGNPPGV